MLESLKNNPAIVVSTITAILAVLVSFGVPLQPEQQTALIGLAPIISGLITRQLVYGPVTVEKLKAAK